MMSMENITLTGIIIQTLIFVIGGYTLIIRHDESGKTLAKQIDSIEHEMKALAKVITQIAVQSVRLDNLGERINLVDKRLDELRHGDGVVLQRGKT